MLQHNMDTKTPINSPCNESSSFGNVINRVYPDGLRAADRLTTLQLNIGLKCNLTCRHCHVNSSPKRKEEMDWHTMQAALNLAHELGMTQLDITGGAPEMHPHIKRLIQHAREQHLSVTLRTNLTIHLEPGYEDLITFFKKNHVTLVASLPCYTEENVNQQRGEGVYHDSILVLRTLNEAGYGIEPHLPLNLVYNPGGPSLPPSQDELETQYRKELLDQYGLQFTSLITITNVPIGRFKTDLRSTKQLASYRHTLHDAFNPQTVPQLMCRHQISVAWDGTLYDCDFNLALRMPIQHDTPNIRHITPADLVQRSIAIDEHCFACTAGDGSSCTGALVVHEESASS